jgi:membrane-associated phospholipid phosphatase
MKQSVILYFIVCCLAQSGLAQNIAFQSYDSDKTASKSSRVTQNLAGILSDHNQNFQDRDDSGSPYSTKFKIDAPVIVGGVGLTALGVYLIQNKKDLTPQELAAKSKGEVPFFDRGSAGFYSDKLNDDSYIPFYGAFGLPIVLGLIDKNERNKFGQVLVLYTETMAITGGMFTIAAGAIHRSRPLVYGTKAPISLRLAKKSQRSFYAGHTAASAAATFFAAQIFQDFNPDSKARPYVWTVAAIVPAVVGYLRYKSGMHFLSDNILGYVIGAGTGILIPKLHRSKALKNINVTPETGYNYKGISLTYHF